MMTCARYLAILFVVIAGSVATIVPVRAADVLLQPLSAGLRAPLPPRAPAVNPKPESVQMSVASIAVAVNTGHTCAITVTGAVMCWGHNGSGELGDGTDVGHWIPMTVHGLTSGVKAIAVGVSHTCAITTGGDVKCWGDNSYGQLGDGTTTGRWEPVAVTNLLGGVLAISAGYEHTCAITTAGGVKCWGANYLGQLGDGTRTNSSTPVEVVGLTSGVQAIAVGDTHTCAVTETGGVKCWGYNHGGQLGDGTATDRLTPVDVVGIATGAKAVGAGVAHSCAVMVTGGVKCWGQNGYSQLGDGTNIGSLIPVDVVNLSMPVATVAAGATHTCALTDANSVQCWGSGFYGELGDGTTQDHPTPNDVAGLTSGVTMVSAGNAYSCAIVSAGSIKCWGYNGVGQLGIGTASFRWPPMEATGMDHGARAVIAGEDFSCALTDSGNVECWGDNYAGKLGDGSEIGRWMPAPVLGLSDVVAEIGAGQNHTCALTEAGGVKCWGDNGSGQLGDGTAMDRSAPVDVIGLAGGVQSIAVGGNHTCALMNTGAVMCWGNNEYGQLGDGSLYNSMVPVDVAGIANVTAIAAGMFHSCALRSGGGVTCWGADFAGQLGDGVITTTHQLPVNVVNLSSGVSAIAAGRAHTCAVTDAGAPKCWGSNGYGQLGDNTRANRPTPTDVSGLVTGISAIMAGGSHTCAVQSTGAVLCWGADFEGQLGDGLRADSLIPVAVRGLDGVAQALAAGSVHTCAVTTTGAVKCWGEVVRGALGVNPGWNPVEVVFPQPLPADPGAFIPSVEK